MNIFRCGKERENTYPEKIKHTKMAMKKSIPKLKAQSIEIHFTEFNKTLSVKSRSFPVSSNNC